MNLSFRFLTRFLVPLALMGTLQPLQAAEADGTMYLAHNLWYERADNVPALGYKRGTRIPAGQKVTDITITKGRYPGVKFTVPEWELTLTVIIGKHQKDVLTVEELKERMFSDLPLDKQMAGFTDQEKTCVERGVIEAGIRKPAALMAYGYPPKHRTPTTNMPSWVYWTSRFVNRTVNFDSDDKALNSVGE